MRKSRVTALNASLALGFALGCSVWSPNAQAETTAYSGDDYDFSGSPKTFGEVQICTLRKTNKARLCKLIDDHQMVVLSPPEFDKILRIEGCKETLFSAGKMYADHLLNDKGENVPIDIATTDGSFFVSGVTCSDGLIRVDLKGRYGFINSAGKTVIAPTLKNASHFKLGLAAASKDGKTWGYLNPRGEFAIAPTIEVAPKEGSAGDFRQLSNKPEEAAARKFAAIQGMQGCWYIDESGAKVFGNKTYLSCASEDEAWGKPFVRVEVEKGTWAPVGWDGQVLAAPRKALELLSGHRSSDYDFKPDEAVLLELKLADGSKVCVTAKDKNLDEKTCAEHVLGSNGTMGGSVAEDREMTPIFWGIIGAIALVGLAILYGLYRLVRRFTRRKKA